MTITGINLITGLIGSGKSLHSVGLMAKEVESGRPTFACNYKGLNVPGVIEIEDPRQWQDLPTGSVLFVDEAQRFWRVRRSTEIPPEIQAMETSRGEEGVSIVLVTQQPTYIDKHIRGLVTRHTHVFRRMGLNAAELMTWERCHDDPMSAGSKDGADKVIWPYPKQDFTKYKSAEVHTVKRNLGARMKLVIVAAIAVVSLVGWVVWDISKSDDSAIVEQENAAPGSGASAQPKARTGARAPATTSEYIEAMAPRIEMAPWSAPLFDGQRAQAKSEVYCIHAAAGVDAQGINMPEHCTCLTEQGTPYYVSQERCQVSARTGPVYNPFKRQETPRQRQPVPEESRVAKVEPSAQGRVDGASGTPYGSAASYGDLALDPFAQ